MAFGERWVPSLALKSPGNINLDREVEELAGNGSVLHRPCLLVSKASRTEPTRLAVI